MHTAAERYRLGFSWLLGIFFVFTVCFTKTPYDGSPLYESLEYLGYILVMLATLGRIWATVYIGGRKDEELLCDGPYSVVRNPLYVFSFFGAVGLVIGAGKMVLLLVVMPFFIYNYFFVIKGEEARLVRIFGDSYVQYMQKVNRVWPSFRHYWSRQEFTIYPLVFFRSMVHASFFIWLFLLLEIFEYFKAIPAVNTVLLTLPF